MTGIRGFMTVCCLGDYRPIVDELVDALLDSRLYERSESIEIAVLGGPDDQASIDDLIGPFDRLRVVHRSDNLSEYEFPALGRLQDTCRSWSGSVYYLHTKGVSHPLNQYGAYWRRLMLDVVVVGHDECLEALNDYDAVGTNWRGNHYSGNFWWARAAHIRSLPDIRGLRSRPRPLTRDPVWNIRLQCELWIGMSRGRFGNIGPAELDLYRTLRWRHDAADVVNLLLASAGGGRYLEVVSEGPSPYHSRVNAQIKDVVRVAPTERVEDTATHEVVAAEPYDVVFVDSWHAASHCLEVLEWSLDRIRPFGAIVVHDSNPPTAWHQRSPTDFDPGTEWNGEAWQAVAQFRRRHPEMDVRTVDVDWGCTVIRADVPARDAIEPDDQVLTWDLLEHGRARLLNLVSMRRFRRDLYWVPIAAGLVPLTSRTQLLNCLISYLGLERYLEIGAGGGDNFEAIIAPVRQSVDPAGAPTFAMTSDEFFARRLGCPVYDLIFIDAFHEADACLRDIENALERLAPRGWIVVHDTNPPTEWHQRSALDFVPGSEWNGTVWKAIVRLRERHPDLGVVTLDVDWGCTIIGRGTPGRPMSVHPETLDWPVFAAHRHELLELVPATWAELERLVDG
jgi:predicted O-methyltransferase YrrM